MQLLERSLPPFRPSSPDETDFGFGDYGDEIDRRAISLLNDLYTLNYVSFDNLSQELQFTQAGMKYLNRNLNTVLHFMAEYRIRPDNCGSMGRYLPQIFSTIDSECNRQLSQLHGYPIKNSQMKTIVTGETIIDMDTVTFTEKAAGEVYI